MPPLLSFFSCHLFLNSLAFVRLLFLSNLYRAYPCMNVVLIVPIFLKGCLVFPTLLFSSISRHCSFKKAFLSLLAILWNSAFSWYIFPFLPCLLLLFFPQIFVRPPQTAILPACVSFSLGCFLVTDSFTVLQTSIHSSSGIWSTRSSHLNLFMTSTV